MLRTMQHATLLSALSCVTAALFQAHDITFAHGASRMRQPRMEVVGADTRFEILSGRVLTPGSAGSGWWDGRCAAMPVVLPPSDSRSNWQCYYYGRPSDKWNNDLPAFLPTGIAGLAESEDGLNWKRVRGPLEEGAVLRPSDDPTAFDHIHVGITDVVKVTPLTERGSVLVPVTLSLTRRLRFSRTYHTQYPLSGGSYAALYFGGSGEEVSLGMGPGPIKGFKMRPGAATSRDGLRWERCDAANPLLDVGAEGTWDSAFCSWPRALPLDPAQPDGPWLMTYHALMPPGTGGVSAPRWAVGAAVSEAGHALGPWTKLSAESPVLRGGGAGTFDEAGIGTRHVVHAVPPADNDSSSTGEAAAASLVMIYEGVAADGRHRLGLATSADGGASWAKMEGLGPDPGGPIFEGAAPETDAWDNGNVGTPWVVRLPSGRWRLYYVGTSSKGRAVAIGAAEADELFSTSWTRVGVSASGLCVDEVDGAGETPLIMAAERGDLATATALLAAGADAQAASYSGWTAMHGAAEHGSVGVVELLAAAGADVSAKAGCQGKTPLDIARQYERPEAEAALRALGAAANLSA